jgi:drug/metabolite transporter (DMT)-like permease
MARHAIVPARWHAGLRACGLAAGALFALEFMFIYAGLAHTTASRMVVFIYLTPCLTALGVHLFVPGERLALPQWLGVGLAFLGVAAAFGEGFSSAQGETALGDLFGIIGAVWRAIRRNGYRFARPIYPPQPLYSGVSRCAVDENPGSPCCGASNCCTGE